MLFRSVLFMGGGARFAIGLTLKPMVEELGWDRGHIGAAVAIFQVVSAAAMYFAGILADRRGPRAELAGGLFIAGCSIAAMSLVSEPWHVMLVYGILFAVGNGAASIAPVSVMVTRAYPDKTGFANAVATSGMSVGQLVLMAMFAAVLALIGWRSVFLWLGVAHLLLLPLLFAVPALSPAAQPKSPPDGMTVREAARTKPFWVLMMVYAVCGFGDFFVGTHVVAFAQDRGIDPYIAGNLLAIMGLAGLLGVLLAGAWSDRTGPVGAAAACFMVRALIFAWVLIDQSPMSVAVFALSFGLTFLVTAPLTPVFVRDAFGARHLGALTGLITMVHHIFGGIGAYWGARVFDAAGRYDQIFVVQLLVSLVAMVLMFALRRPPVARES